MKERPILFQGAMVRAILKGSKIQTRRLAPISDLNIRPNSNDLVTWGVSFTKPVKGVLGSYSGGRFSDLEARSIIASQFNPYGVPGDRLWVRETFYALGRWETRFSEKKGRDEWHFIDMTVECGHQYAYPADGYTIAPHRRTGGVSPTWWKRPAIHMPRAASRITLEVTGVRVERLQDISEADAIAEGIEPDVQPGDSVPLWRNYRTGNTTASPVYSYESLWESINGPSSWDANPFVWVVEFKRAVP